MSDQVRQAASERDEFEAFCRNQYAQDSFTRSHDGYISVATHQAMHMMYASVEMLWETWQHARASLPAREGALVAGEAAPQVEPMREALTELVALKGLKDLIERHSYLDHPIVAEYERRKGPAWEAARAALASAPTPEAAPPLTDASMAALQELVACKDLKDRIDAHDSGQDRRSTLLSMMDEYERRKPVAWQVARAIVKGEVNSVADDLDLAKMVVRGAGYSLVSRDFIVTFAEFIHDWKKGDFNLPLLALHDLQACWEAWQREPNASELAAAPPLTDAQIVAKPLKWENHSPTEWIDDIGFFIRFDPEDDPGEPYSASWGEGDSKQFKTLEAAQDWCYFQLQDWLRECGFALAAAPPLATSSASYARTHGRTAKATDILARSPACSKWQPKTASDQGAGKAAG